MRQHLSPAMAERVVFILPAMIAVWGIASVFAARRYR